MLAGATHRLGWHLGQNLITKEPHRALYLFIRDLPHIHITARA